MVNRIIDRIHDPLHLGCDVGQHFGWKFTCYHEHTRLRIRTELQFKSWQLKSIELTTKRELNEWKGSNIFVQYVRPSLHFFPLFVIPAFSFLLEKTTKQKINDKSNMILLKIEVFSTPYLLFFNKKLFTNFFLHCFIKNPSSLPFTSLFHPFLLFYLLSFFFFYKSYLYLPSPFITLFLLDALSAFFLLSFDFSLTLEFNFIFFFFLTRSQREPGGPCTKSMKVSESRMEWV